MNTTLNSITIQRFRALQGQIIPLVEQDYAGLTLKLEQIIRALEWSQIKIMGFRDRGYCCNPTYHWWHPCIWQVRRLPAPDQ